MQVQNAELHPRAAAAVSVFLARPRENAQGFFFEAMNFSYDG